MDAFGIDTPNPEEAGSQAPLTAVSISGKRQRAQYEPVAWWWTKNEIGQDLRECYEVPKDLPPELLTLVRKLDDSDLLFPAVGWRNDVHFLP
jgi:hypothetical protein